MQFRVKTFLVSAFAFASVFTAAAQEAGETVMLTLEDALRIALSENASVKVADMEVKRSEYARKGTYASLLPQIDASGAYQRTIKKQVMYMDGGGFNFGDMIGEALMDYLLPLYAQHPGVMPPMSQAPAEPEEEASKSAEGISVGRWNTFSTGISASLPLVNFQLWQSIKISGQDVELAVEKARSSRLDMVAQVKQAFYAVLLAKESANVYSDVLKNAEDNFVQTEMRYKVQKASELEYARAKSTVQNAVPNVYNAESSVLLALWQLKALIGVDLDMDVDVVGSLDDYTNSMLSAVTGEYDLDRNSTMRQLAIQAEEIAASIKTAKAAYLPSLALSFSYNVNAMTNDFKFSEFNWTPYSFAGLSLQIPIFSGGRRYNQVKQAQVQQSEFLIQKENTERQLKIAIRSYVNTMETSMKNYHAALSGVDLAQKAYDIAAQSYNVGRSTITELNDAQLALTQARLGASSAVYNFMVAKSNLEQMIGADFTE